jgi:hypothetical protein
MSGDDEESRNNITGDGYGVSEKDGRRENIPIASSQPIPQPKAEWNVDLAREAIRKCREGDPRRLPFETQCAIFAFAYDGMPNRILARAFDVSQTTVSNITGCLERDPNPYRREYKIGSYETFEGTKWRNPDIEQPVTVPDDHNARRNSNRSKRYDQVRREFEVLGETAFYQKYLTKECYRMVAAARREIITEKGRVAIDSDNH